MMTEKVGWKRYIAITILSIISVLYFHENCVLNGWGIIISSQCLVPISFFVQGQKNPQRKKEEHVGVKWSHFVVLSEM